MVALKNNHSLLIKWFITIVVPLLLLLIPLNETYTALMRSYLIVTLFVIFLFAFETLPMLISALLLPALYVVLNIVPFAIAYSPWTQTTIPMVLGGFLIANICSECGILNRISLWIVSRCKGSFIKIALGIFLANWLICLLTFGNGSTVGIVFSYALCQAMHYGRTKEGAIIMSASIMGSALCNHMVYNPLAMGIALPAAQTVAPNLSITMVDLFVAFWPLAVFSVLMILIYGKMYKIPMSAQVEGGESYIKNELAGLGAMSNQEKKAMLLLIIILLYMLFQPLHHLGMEYAFMIMPLVAFFPGIGLGSSECIKKIPFDMLFFVAACASIGTVGMQIGLGALVSTLLIPAVATFGNSFFLIGVFFMCLLANFLMTPIAMYAAFPAALIASTIEAGIDPQSILYTVFLGGDLLFLPYESANYLIMFSFGVMTMKDFVVTSTVRTILLIIFFIIILMPYWALIGVR